MVLFNRSFAYELGLFIEILELYCTEGNIKVQKHIINGRLGG
jgi:hypothetical protein